MPDPKEDPVTARASSLRGEIEKLLSNPVNGVSALQPELRALSHALGRTPKWLARTDAPPLLRNLAEVAMIHVESTVKSIPGIPPHGPESTSKTDEIRPKLTGALAQLLVFGMGTVEKDEGEIAVLVGAVDKALAGQRKEYEAVLAAARGAVEMAKKAAETATESAKKVGVTVQMTAFTMAKETHRKWAIGWAVATGVVAFGLAA
jgi:hypothetical protein